MTEIIRGGVSIDFTDHGAKAAGGIQQDSNLPVMFFHHGFFMNSAMFDAQVREFSPHYRCVTVDARGHGQSGVACEPLTYYDLADDAVSILDQLGIETAHWVGHSQGGFTSLRAALKHPERVTSLTLIGSEGTAPDAEKKAGYEELRQTWEQHGPLQPILEGLASQLIGAPELWGDWPASWARLFTWERLEQPARCLTDRDDVDSQLKLIAAPTLVLSGYQDASMSAKGQLALASALPHSTGPIFIEGAAHSPNLSHPAQVNRVIEGFLNSL